MKTQFIYKTLKGTKLNIALIIILSIISSYLITLIPLYIKYAIDGVAYNSNKNIPDYIVHFFYSDSYQSKLLIICVFLLLINIIIGIIKYFKSWAITKFNIKININVKKTILNHTTDLELKSFTNIDSSKIIQQVNTDTNTYTSFFDLELTLFIDTFFVVIFAIYNSFKLNIPITIYIIICILLLFIASIIFFKKTTSLAQRQITASEKVIETVNNIIKNIRTIKMYSKENVEKENFAKVNQAYKKASNDLLTAKSYYNGIAHTINISKNAFVVTIGGYFVVKGSLSLGALAALLQYTSTALENSRNVARKFQNITEFYIAYKRLNKFLELNTEQEIIPLSLSGDIIFENVSIKLENQIILKDLNFKIEEGKSYAIVGPNGSGKSILLKTILGLYNYTGNIYIGKNNLKELNTKTISENISLVLQEPFLFNATIEENICLGNKYNDLTEITKTCDIYNDIRQLKQQFKTEINENLTLSGGQKQRISLARSLYQNKNYLLFDDSLSKLDVLTKNKILMHLQNLSKTIIISTHDYSIAQKIENILFINNNNIIAKPHNVLENENQNYQNLMQISKNKIGDKYE